MTDKINPSVLDANLLEEVVEAQPKQEEVTLCHQALITLLRVEENEIDPEVLFWINRKNMHITEDQLFG